MRLDSDFIVNVPLARVSAEDFPAMHLRVDDTAALIAAADKLPWSQIEEVTLPGLDDFRALEPHHNRCRWSLRWTGFDVGQLLDLQRPLRRSNVSVLVAPDDPDLYDKLLVGESLSLNMRVDIGDPDAMDLAALNNLVTYVLVNSASRQVRIEPIMAMMRTAGGGDRRTLWDQAREDVRHNMWVNDDGRVSLSARLLDSHTYTTVDKLAATDFGKTDPFVRLDEYQEKQFREQTECSSCQAFPLCGGWLRYADPDYDCEVWQLVLNALAEAVGDRERAKVLPQTP